MSSAAVVTGDLRVNANLKNTNNKYVQAINEGVDDQLEYMTDTGLQ